MAETQPNDEECLNLSEDIGLLILFIKSFLFCQTSNGVDDNLKGMVSNNSEVVAYQSYSVLNDIVFDIFNGVKKLRATYRTTEMKILQEILNTMWCIHCPLRIVPRGHLMRNDFNQTINRELQFCVEI